jgi:hypothetical protein
MRTKLYSAKNPPAKLHTWYPDVTGSNRLPPSASASYHRIASPSNNGNAIPVSSFSIKCNHSLRCVAMARGYFCTGGPQLKIWNTTVGECISVITKSNNTASEG